MQPPRIAIRPTTAKPDVIHKTGSTLRIVTPPEKGRATATGDLHKKFREDRFSASRDMLADRQTDRQTDRNTPRPYRGSNKNDAALHDRDVYNNFVTVAKHKTFPSQSSLYPCTRLVAANIQSR